MTPKFLIEMWTAAAPALGNHLWQSTLFACAAALLTLAFRNNHARTRYALWLAASLKFLVPFSLLSNLGSYLASSHAAVGTRTVFYSALEQFGQPFPGQTIPGVSQSAPATVTPSPIHLLPVLIIVWLSGFLVVALVWFMRWLHVRDSIRGAVPLSDGREVEALRRLERLHAMPGTIKILLSRTTLEPGIFGIAHPVLVWPQGISDRLDDPHLEAVLAHEMRHVRRRDNLAAALHMLVEAVFWFHPLVWWLGTRLIAERERACDEEVLESGSDRQVYAESILKICEFCVGSPLTCVSGVTGADLKKRIERIMSGRDIRRLDFLRKLFLCAAGLAVFAVPFSFGLLSPTQTHARPRAQVIAVPSFVYQTVSITPNGASTAMFKSGIGAVPQKALFSPTGLTITGTSLRYLIQMAYGVQGDRVSGAVPDWVDSQLYDVEAHTDTSTADKLQSLHSDQLWFARGRMLQSLLADHFKLATHRETKDLPVYALLIADGGPKLREATPGNGYPNGIKGPDGRPAGEGIMGGSSPDGVSRLTAQAIPMSSLVQRLSWQMGRTVLDMTGLRGTYDFTLQWPTDNAKIPREALNRQAPDSSNPSFFSALQQQLGLKLEPKEAPMEVIVIDHVEKPSPN
jgi:bla regulator protein blaR1